METDGQTPMLEGDDLLAGRYRLLEKIGEGGAAEVFRAKDIRLDRIVAIKLLRPQYTHDDSSRRRFVVEAKAAAALSHPNIVDIYDFGEAADGAMFIAMQFIEGKNLKDILQKRGRLSPAEAITISIQACHALSAAHAKGLIHRDVKPQNIMIDERGNAHLTDFGVVKALSGPSLTQSGMTFGTAAYLSPEQATGEPVGPASDIYALGCVMYECLSGQPPFTGDNPAIVAYKQVWEQPRPLHEIAPEVFPSLESVIMRCLNKDPGRRYPNSETLAAELESLSVTFNQPTQAVALGAMAATGDNAGNWTPAGQRASAELSQPVQMTAAPNEGNRGVPYHASAHPPMSVPVPRVAAPPQRPAPQVQQYEPQPLPPVVNVSTTRRAGWVPMAIAALLLLGLGGAGVWLGSSILGSRNGPIGNATPTATLVAVVVVPTDIVTDTAIALAPTSTLAPPTAVITSTDTPTTPLTPTEMLASPTKIPAPPPPANTPAPTATTPPVEGSTATIEPQPAPTDTTEPAPETTSTAVPEPPLDTPTPEPEIDTASQIVIQDTSFTGGYTNANGLYHNVTAHWVYGQRTQYSKMTARFTVDKAPKGVVALTLEAVDSEDPSKTPISIVLNNTTIFSGPNPFPNDTVNNPSGPGNWGSYTWQVPPKVIKNGSNTLTITNLGQTSCTNCPNFFMLDSATVSWGGSR